MKKSIVALAIAAAAVSGAANAKVDIYSDNGLAVQVSGEVDATLKTGKWDEDGKDNDVTNDPTVKTWGNVQFDAQYRVSSSTTAFASFEVEADNGEGAKVDDAVAGFENDAAGKFSFGETGSALDAVKKTDITNEGLYVATMDHPTESAGHGVRWQKNVAGLELSADVQTDEASESNIYGLSVDWAVNDMFTVGAAYVDQGEEGGADTNLMALSAAVDIDNFYIAATVSQYENLGGVEYNHTDDQVKFEKTDGMSYGVALAYQMDATRVYGTYEVVDADSLPSQSGDYDATINSYTLGVDHQLVDNVLVFAEYNGVKLDGDQTSEGTGDRVILGAYLTF